MKVTFYVQLEPRWNAAGTDITGATAARVTSRYPTVPISGGVITKITLDVDPVVFAPLEAVGRLGAGDVQIMPMEVSQPEEVSA